MVDDNSLFNNKNYFQYVSAVGIMFLVLGISPGQIPALVGSLIMIGLIIFSLSHHFNKNNKEEKTDKIIKITVDFYLLFLWLLFFYSKVKYLFRLNMTRRQYMYHQKMNMPKRKKAKAAKAK